VLVLASDVMGSILLLVRSAAGWRQPPCAVT
jgi:hypothetical protein